MKISQYLYAIALLIGLSCSGPKKSTPLTQPDRAEVPADTHSRISNKPIPTQTESATTSTVPTQAGTWLYKETIGEGGIKAYTASVHSADVLTFEKPFDGGATATLTVRRRNGSTTVSLRVSKGQFTSSFQGGQVRIRFDNGPAGLYAFSAAANGNTDIIFLEPVQPLIQKLKAAGKTVINAGFYGQGTRQIGFKTAGLRWKE